MLLGLGVAAVIAAARVAGWFETIELGAYDAAVRAVHSPAVEPPVVIVEETEEDLRRWGFPMSDGNLARALRAILSLEPAALGVDKYRDMPVAPGEAELDALLRADARIVWITKFGGAGDTGVLAPRALQGSGRIGFNDIVDDPGGMIRRGLLFLDDGKQSMTAFSLLLAQRYLAARGVSLGPSTRNPDWVLLGSTEMPPFEPHDGGYAGADAGGYQFLIDFVHAPLKIPSFTVTQALEGRIPRGAVEGRIVVYGASAVSLRDYFYTPHSRGRESGQRISGVELQGQITAQLVRAGLGEPAMMRTIPDAAEYGVLAALAFLGAMAGFVGHSTLRFVLVAVAGTGAIAGISLYALAHQAWLPPVPWIAAWIAATGLSASYRAWRERQDRGELMQLFSRHISGAVAESLWLQRDAFMDGGRARPQHLTATVLFTDIRGFTTVTERMDAAHLVEWLNEYMERMAGAVLRNDGIINKYIGDAIMALFGVPVARQMEAEIARDALRAVRCAWEMRAELEALNDGFERRGLPPVGMRVGIFTGPLVAGSMGSADRLEYTVIGDTVNTASRLESYKLEGDVAPCRILIGEATYLLVRDAVEVELVGEVELKGKASRVTVYRVNAVR